MAQDLEKLVVQLSADIKGFDRAMSRAVGVTNRQAKAVEDRFRKMNSNINSSFRNLLSGSIAGIGTVLGTREILGYAEAWTKAKNSLAVAGVTGEKQVKTLQKLFELSQANAAPLEATVQLYGRASMAAENLGASQDELIQFSDSVGLALKVSGQSATEASGALLQLSQALQGNKIQSQEYNSLIDGMYPLLQAAAAGSAKWGGSVSKLSADVKASKVTAQEFFRAILAGTDTLRTRAAAATQTLGQSLTKVNNAFTKYIGGTDESLGATQRLVIGMNALADNFDDTADVAIQLATVLGTALVGRAIGGMIASIPTATGSVIALVSAMRAGTLTAGGFAAALGPLGLIAGLAAGAAIAFGKWGNSVDSATQALAAQAREGGAVESMIADAAKAQDAYKKAIATTASAQTAASNSIVADTKKEFEAKKSLLELELKRQRALLAVQQANLEERGSALKSEIGSKVFTRNSGVERGFSDPRVGNFVRQPDDITGLEKTQSVIDNSPITAEIKKIRAEMSLTELGAQKLEEALNSTFGTSEGGKGGAGGGDGGKGSGKKLDDYEQMKKRIAEATAATIAETEAQKLLNPTIEDYGYALEKARAAHELLTAAKEAEKKITPELAAEIDRLAEAYAQASVQSEQLAEKQDEVRQAAENAMSTAKDVTRGLVDGFLEGEKAADVFANALKRIGSALLDDVFNNMFKIQNLGGGGGGFLSSIFGGLFGGGGKSFFPAAPLPMYASGTSSARSGMALVGEKGPELVRFKGGEQVVPNHQLAAAMRAPSIPDMKSISGGGGGGGAVNVNFSPVYNVQGSGPEIAQLRAQMAKDRAELPTRVEGAVRDARKRNVKF
ncbi:tape measure protein [Agrobacterium rhizogenes]|uniref:tape measure protein n=1 Tax=Rhizobium rhizogenes TaxID=359 RepID=UPI0022B6933E|nr:tape measure protein [Rhizobium rhizogenes]MCZ7451316.1 tape measure protein [Rhizobium rhizogenes]